MSRELRYDISMKSSISSSHKLWAGSFPQEFNGNSKNTTLEVKQNCVIAKEETIKPVADSNLYSRKTKAPNEIKKDDEAAKKVVKIKQYKGIEVKSQTSKHILLILEDKKVRFIPIDNWCEFKSSVDVDPRLQEELQRYSNDPEYEKKVAKSRLKSKGAAEKLIEDFSSQARKDAGIDGIEEQDIKETLKSRVRKQKENLNKEEADFDEFEDIFHDNEENDIVNKGIDYIPDDSDEEEFQNKKPEANPEVNAASKSLNLVRKNTNLNEDGKEVLQIMKKESRMNPNDSESDESELSQESDEDEESDGYKIVQNSAQKKNNYQQPVSRYVEEENDEIFNQYDSQVKAYVQPPMQKNYSESSDLFADSPQVNSKGSKRVREDEDFSSGSYKRFKN